MKKLALLLALLLVVSCLSSCGSDADTTDNPLPTGIPESPEPEDTAQEALKIGDVSISVAEFDFYYNDAYHSIVEMYDSMGFLDYLGLDSSLPFSEQEYEEGLSWQDYFKESAIETLTEVVLQSEEAKKEGITLTEADYEGIEYEIESMQLYAEEEGITVDSLMQAVYGSNMTEKMMRTVLERSFLADRYRTSVWEGYNTGEDEVSEYYEKNKGDFSYVDYHNFIFDAELYEESLGRVPTEEEQESYKEAQRVLAQRLYDKVTTAAGFLEAAAEFLDDEGFFEEDEDDGEDVDITYQEGIYISELEAEQAAFLSDPARKEGDKILIEGDGYFEVILYVDRYIPLDVDWKAEVLDLLEGERYAEHLDALRGSYPVTENPEGMALAMQPLPE